MSASAPWSVKGIDAKAREVAKDLARRSGMTLGEWLNQMILEGQDVGAMIREERNRTEPASTGSRFAEPRKDEGDVLELGRVARALEALGERIETSESRSGGAVRSVSAAVESLIERLDRRDGGRARPVAHETIRETDRPSRPVEVEGSDLLAERLGQAERQLNAQTERLEGLSGHLREERERVSRLEAQVADGAMTETVRAVEGVLGKLSNQVFEGEARTRDSLKALGQDMLGLSHRLAQMEMRDPERTAQVVVNKVVAQMSQRLEAAEAQTSTSIRNLEQAFKALEERVAEGAGDAAAAKSLSGLAAELSQQVAESRNEWRQALNDSRQQNLDDMLRSVDERIGAAEKRSASAIERLGQDVLRVAGNLNRRMTGVEAQSRDGLNRMNAEMQRVAGALDARMTRSEGQHAQALERLGGEIARISERLNAKLADSERRTTEILSSIGEQVSQQRDHVREDLAERIRQSEERTAKLLEETRVRIDDRLARVQTESLLSEATRAPKAEAGNDLPNPFDNDALDDAPDAFEPAPPPKLNLRSSLRAAAAAPEAGPDIDLTGHLLGGVTDFSSDYKPEFDPFEPEGLDDTLEPAAHQDHGFDDDDHDPFADIDVSRKTAPRQRVMPETASRHTVSRDHLDIDLDAPLTEKVSSDHAVAEKLSYELEPEPLVSMSTRDALAAARAAVRASIEGDDRGGLLGNLKAGASRRQAAAKSRNPDGKGGGTVLSALKASSIAGALVVVGATGYLAFKNTASGPSKANGPIAATAVDVTSASATAQDQQALKERYDLALKALDARAPGAVDALKTVAGQGYAPAQYRLSLLYSGQDHIIPADKMQARIWAQRAAEGGVAKAMFNLGTMYYEGDGGPQDHSTAAMWFRKAAERGVKDSQYNLGVLYERGDGVPLNPTEAYKWLRIVGNSGDKVAAREADDLAGQLTDEQRQRAEDSINRFTPITDGPVTSSSSEG